MPTRSEALAAQRAGSLRQAETLYRRALAENPDDVDVIHMLGVVMLERLRYREALDFIFDAAERTGWGSPQIRHNLGLAVAKLLVRDVNARQTSLIDAFVAWERAHAARPDIEPPLVSVVMRAYNHARFVGEAIASVATQTYRTLELVIVDEGSTDGTAEAIARTIEGLPFPVRFVARSHKGAPATLNEAAAMACGTYLSFLDPDDCYAPDRVAAMVDAVARPALAWGFSLVDRVGAEAPATGAAEAPAGGYWQMQRSLLGSDTNSFALVQNNVAVCTGNLFVARDFFASLGGFRELRYNHAFHDWDFCLRAAALAEPMVVRRPLYFYRMQGANTINESA
ncbi:MAG TPA: glycosyltransferase, partial [Casimicrobiaceae bacterium]|nr:glycosyltransferase [Casimicrobiaceae bacterium]